MAPLRSDPLAFSGPVVITIDGPAGTGKSTVARLLARRLGLDFLDTGAMYRAATLIVLERGLDLSRVDHLLDAVARANITFDWRDDPPAILVGGQRVGGRIREPDVTELVSRVASVGPLRTVMVGMQREIARQHPRLVTEGRDQGTVVFPDAPMKFFLDASPEVRAIRRANQLRDLGMEGDVDRLLGEIVERDRSDSQRHDGPLRCPRDAMRVDTSHLSLEQVVDRLEADCRAAFSASRSG
ncbi:MAG: (d)CMP kinase [Planctomycetota bacterium]|nr:(d)CMP kinase [Planctomycetota bacterium]